MPLKASQPDTKEKRLKLLVYGPAGVGKTTASIQFPNAVLIDMEHGSDNYSEAIKKAGSIVLNTTNPEEVKAEIKTLLTEKHPYKSLILDPVTVLYGALQDKWNRIFEKYATSEKQAELQDFGFRYWARVKSEYKSIMRMLTALDMNIIVTSHQKDIYGTGMQRVGVGPDSMKGDDYVFDYVFQLDVVGGKRMARTMKERAPIGQSRFPETFVWSYENFTKFYGKEAIEKESTPVALATDEQIAEIKRLTELVNIPQETINGWFEKADADDWNEMTAERIKKCIEFVKKKLEPVSGESKGGKK